MRFSAKRCAYSDMPSFSSQSAICCMAALCRGSSPNERTMTYTRRRPAARPGNAPCKDRGKSGRRRNRHEVDLYRRSSARRRSMLCPVLWCSRPAFVSIMRRATTPVTKGALDERKGVAWLEWDYAGPRDDGPRAREALVWVRVAGCRTPRPALTRPGNLAIC